MTTLIWCLFIAALLPFIAKGPVAYAMNKLGGYNNNHPREQQSNLTGFGARALAAHQNAFESLMIFAPAVLLAIATQHTGENKRKTLLISLYQILIISSSMPSKKMPTLLPKKLPNQLVCLIIYILTNLLKE